MGKHLYLSLFAMMSFTYLPQIYTSRRQRKNENMGKKKKKTWANRHMRGITSQGVGGSTIDTFIFTDYNIIHYYGLWCIRCSLVFCSFQHLLLCISLYIYSMYEHRESGYRRAHPVYIEKELTSPGRELQYKCLCLEQAAIQASRMTLIYTSSQPIKGLSMTISPKIANNYTKS